MFGLARVRNALDLRAFYTGRLMLFHRASTSFLDPYKVNIYYIGLPIASIHRILF